jgi:hypothetical protein
VEWLQATPDATVKDCIARFAEHLRDNANNERDRFADIIRKVALIQDQKLVLRPRKSRYHGIHVLSAELKCLVGQIGEVRQAQHLGQRVDVAYFFSSFMFILASEHQIYPALLLSLERMRSSGSWHWVKKDMGFYVLKHI